MKTWHRFNVLSLLVLIGWLSFLTWSLLRETTPPSPSFPSNAITVQLPLSLSECSGAVEAVKVGTPVSLSAADGGIVSGAGTSVFIAAQRHHYGSFTPNHLSVVSLANDTVLLGLGEYVVVGDGRDDWVSGESFNFNFSTGATPPPGGWGPACALPLFVDEIVLLSSENGVALLVGVGGGGAMGFRVDLFSKVVTIGDHVSFVKGASVDTDTAAIGSSSFAISYYMDSAGGSIQLRTIAGSLTPNLTVAFGSPLSYSPNHMFHQILSLGPNLYALAFPNDDVSGGSSVASPMAVLIASVSAGNVVTLWSADGRGAPWLQSDVLGYFFFDMTLVDRVVNADGLTATAAMAVVDRSAADAITIITFTASASGTGAGGTGL